MSLRYKAPPYYNRSINTYILNCEVILLWTTAVSNIHAFIDFGNVDNIGLFFLIIGAPFFAFAYSKILDAKTWMIMTSDFKSLKKNEDVELYVNILLNLIDMRGKYIYNYLKNQSFNIFQVNQ